MPMNIKQGIEGGKVGAGSVAAGKAILASPFGAFTTLGGLWSLGKLGKLLLDRLTEPKLNPRVETHIGPAYIAPQPKPIPPKRDFFDLDKDPRRIDI